ncbi:cytochrome P450 [Trametes maxima]|nr:cytochrome P450 [Trametes maxima]
MGVGGSPIRPIAPRETSQIKGRVWRTQVFSPLLHGNAPVRVYVSPSGSVRPPPPGPRPLLLVGNVLDVPTENMEVQYRAHCDKYGDSVVYINVFGQPILVLGSHEAAVDLLEKRSALYLDRLESAVVDFRLAPHVLIVLLLVGASTAPFPRFVMGNAAVVIGERSTSYLIQFCQGPGIFRPRQRVQVARFLQRLFESPKNLSHNGLRKGIRGFQSSTGPRKYLVELFWELRYLPRWAPGARFKRDAEDVRQIVRDVRDVPLKRTVEAMRDGTAKTSMATTLMAQISGKDGVVNREEEEVTKNTVAVAFGAGTDTTLAATQAFFLTLLSFLEVQKKAQAELDAVVGPHPSRLPNFDDTGEALRHDDEYRGYYIPKGALRVLPNLRAYAQDEWWYSGGIRVGTHTNLVLNGF